MRRNDTVVNKGEGGDMADYSVGWQRKITKSVEPSFGGKEVYFTRRDSVYSTFKVVQRAFTRRGGVLNFEKREGYFARGG